MNKILFIFTLFVLGTLPTYASIVSSDVSAYYKLEQNGNDEKGVYNLSDGGATISYPTGAIGYGFNSTSSTAVLYRGNSAMSGTSDWSLSFALKTDNFGSPKWIADIGDSSQGYAGLLYIFLETDGHLYVQTPGIGTLIFSSGNLANNVKHHIVITHSAGNFSLYIDGVLNSTSSHSINLGTGIFVIGSDYVNNRFPFNSGDFGYIDEVGVFNRVLNGTEVSYIYNSGDILQYPFTSSTSTLPNISFVPSPITTIFTTGSTTVPIGSIDFSACDVTSINVNPFASSSLSWGTVSVPQCLLQSVKFLLFGLDGFDTYRITNFINSSSSTLPFLVLKLVGGVLVYINPITGELINLPPTATTSLTFNIPLFGTTTDKMFHMDIQASSSFLNGIHVPPAIDTTLATLELAFFAIMWGLIFKSINV